MKHNQGWGRMKKDKKAPRSSNWEDIIKFKCDKLCEEIEEKLRRSVKVYSRDEYSQEFLRSLVDQKSL